MRGEDDSVSEEEEQQEDTTTTEEEEEEEEEEDATTTEEEEEEEDATTTEEEEEEEEQTERDPPDEERSREEDLQRLLRQLEPSECQMYTKEYSGGDRFIPNRSLMDIPRAITLLTTKEVKSSGMQSAYRRRIEEEMNLDSEGKRKRILYFRGNTEKRIPIPSDGRRRQLDPCRPNRPFPDIPENVFEAPELEDSNMRNLLDWGRSGFVAYALGKKIFIFDPFTRVKRQLREQELQSEDEDDKLAKLKLEDDDDKLDELKPEDDDDKLDELSVPTCVSWSEGRQLAVGYEDCWIKIWDLQTCQVVTQLRRHEKEVNCLCWKNSNELTSGGFDNAIYHYDVRAPNHHWSNKKAEVKGRVLELKWSRARNQLAIGDDKGAINILDHDRWLGSSFVSTLNPEANKEAPIMKLAWSPHDSHVLASGSGLFASYIKFWDTDAGRCINSILTEAEVSGLVWNWRCREILSSLRMPTSIEKMNQPMLSRLHLYSFPTLSTVWKSPDGSAVITGESDGKLRLWPIFDILLRDEM
ncbi:cell division cycle 20.3, cofactor of APC complex-like [Macadamia integrifolia]|uniref:cell division cycle 20.3, cofactor of APC complex-like n=1 Tax=Macadamia integrifolia TaxID=60698 RepID=UPI001C4F7F4A|nr:cell division cycle 20.3, cofactor of APC complex-like [Macadamia integrifolia]